MVFSAFAAGMMYAAACSGGAAHGGIDSANADSSCSNWEAEYVPISEIPAGWEPSGTPGPYDVLVRRCVH